jgi:hypothetical protein
MLILRNGWQPWKLHVHEHDIVEVRTSILFSWHLILAGRSMTLLPLQLLQKSLLHMFLSLDSTPAVPGQSALVGFNPGLLQIPGRPNRIHCGSADPHPAFLRHGYMSREAELGIPNSGYHMFRGDYMLPVSFVCLYWDYRVFEESLSLACGQVGQLDLVSTLSWMCRETWRHPNKALCNRFAQSLKIRN